MKTLDFHVVIGAGDYNFLYKWNNIYAGRGIIENREKNYSDLKL